MTDAQIACGLSPMHPGELLREDVLPALGRPAIGIAKLLNISRQILHAIGAGHPGDGAPAR